MMPTLQKEYGDFQTPSELTNQICAFLVKQGIAPKTIIEPTCGQGNFIFSALNLFSTIQILLAIDINREYIQSLKTKLQTCSSIGTTIKLRRDDFFKVNWQAIFKRNPGPILILGNLPWVTNATLGSLESKNAPPKDNFQKYQGLNSLTGESNFDISEWMLVHLIKWLGQQEGIVAILCKTSVARKVLKYHWQLNTPIQKAQIFVLDGKTHFNIAVEMGLFVCYIGNKAEQQRCDVFSGLNTKQKLAPIEFYRKQVVSNIAQAQQWAHLAGKDNYTWRSGIKHDAVQVMELSKHQGVYQNKLGEVFPLEDNYVYPLLKSSDIAKDCIQKTERWVIIPQTYVGQETAPIKKQAPLTWQYLTAHTEFFSRRKSKIYQNKPLFSIFGIGNYAFAPWKVAIAGLYKKLNFVLIGPYHNKPVMLDDTCYFLGCSHEVEARRLVNILNSDIAKRFFEPYIFWDAKRPIIARVLNKLNIMSLEKELGKTQI